MDGWASGCVDEKGGGGEAGGGAGKGVSVDVGGGGGKNAFCILYDCSCLDCS